MLVPVSQDPLRRPHGTLAPAEGTTIVEKGTAARESTEERESDEAAKELEAYLKESPSGVKIGPRIQSNEHAFEDESWDDEPSFFTHRSFIRRW